MAIKRLKNFGIKNPIKEVKSDFSEETYLLYRENAHVIRCTCMGNSVHRTCKHVTRYKEEVSNGSFEQCSSFVHVFLIFL